MQLLLKRDDLEWKQIKSQIQYKLHTLKNLDFIDDFTYDLDEISRAIDNESSEREIDDQGIINLINDVCQKMYLKF